MRKIFFSWIIFLFLAGFIPELKAFENIKPYGNLYLFFGANQDISYSAGQDKNEDIDLIYRINEHSNLGFNFNYEKYKGVFELGIDDIENDNKVRIRKAYGEYDRGSYKIMIGQDWCPYIKWSHESANYYRSKGFGSMYEEPNIQIKVSFYGFYIDVMKPYVPLNNYSRFDEASTPTTAVTGSDEYNVVTVSREITTGQRLENIKSFIPKFAVGYKINTRYLRLNLGGAANFYYIADSEDVEFNKSWIYSYIGYINSDILLGDFIISFSGGYLVNPANFGIYVQSKGSETYIGGSATAIEDIESGKYEIKDTWNVQAFAEIGWQINSKTLLFAGYGFSLVDYAIPNTQKDYAMEYYINCKINLGGLIALTPSFAWRDYMEDMTKSENKEGRDIFGGILATVSYY